MSSACCCFTGHRPDKFPWGRDEESAAYVRYTGALLSAVEEKCAQGCTCFYTGMAEGFDLWAAQAVLRLKAVRPQTPIRLIAVVPFAGQSRLWRSPARRLYRSILDQADEVIILQRAYARGCYHERNRYLVERCAHMIAGYDGVTSGGTQYTVALARKKGCAITQLNPRDFL